jgi:hypothetical protein
MSTHAGMGLSAPGRAGDSRLPTVYPYLRYNGWAAQLPQALAPNREGGR